VDGAHKNLCYVYALQAPKALKYSQAGAHASQLKTDSRAMTQINKCHRCGATSYKPVIKRDDSGTMKPSGEHQCVGCKLIFTNIDEWRTAPVAKHDLPTQGREKP
jgi:hypothetical protein